MTNRNILLSAASAGVLSAALLGAGTAFAAAPTVSVIGGNVDTTGAAAGTTGYRFATQATTTSTGVISQAAGFLTLTYANNDALNLGDQITVSLPSGFTWLAAPTVALSGSATGSCGSNAAINTGTVSASSPNTVTFTTATAFAVGTSGCTITFSGLNATSGTALQSPVTTALSPTVAVVSSANGARSSAAVTGHGFFAANGWTVTGSNGGATTTIDVSATALGRTFTTATAAAARVTRLATVTPGVNTLVLAANSAAYTLPTGTTFSGAVTGVNFASASRVYLEASGACQTTPGAALSSGSQLATISGNTATVAGLTSTGYALCYEANGSSVIQASTYSASFSSSLSGSASLANGTAATNLGNIAFPGNPTTINYATGGSAYQYFVRVTNPGQSLSTVLAVVTPDSGVTTVGVLNTGLGANANALYSVADLNTATGLSLGAADRFRVQIVTSNSSASASGVLFNTATGVISPAN